MARNEEKLPIQNQAREQQIALMFGLELSLRRLGPDAQDENGNPYELKSTTKGGIGTGRDVSIQMLQEWRRRYWVVGKGVNLVSGFRFDEIYFLSPEMVKGRLNEIEEKIRPDLELCDEVVERLQDHFSDEQLERVSYLMSRGATLNNPKISWKYIQQNGVKIEGNYANRLRELVKQHPLTS